MSSSVRVITPPAVEPVSLVQAKAWCRVDTDDTSQDAVITMLIKAMREYAENITRRAFVERTLELTLERFGGEIELPRAPLISVDWIKYYDVNGDLQTLSAALYEVNTYEQPGEVRPIATASWPATGLVYNAVQIRYRAGYAENGESGSPTDLAYNVPAAVKVWMQARLATLYEHREQMIVGATVNPIPRNFADGLLDALVMGDLLA